MNFFQPLRVDIAGVRSVFTLRKKCQKAKACMETLNLISRQVW